MAREQSAVPAGRAGVTNKICVALHPRTSRALPPAIMTAALLAFAPKPMPAHQLVFLKICEHIVTCYSAHGLLQGLVVTFTLIRNMKTSFLELALHFPQTIFLYPLPHNRTRRMI